jgi:probable rRNA maturation factor
MSKHPIKAGRRLKIDFGTSDEQIRADYRLKCMVRAAIAATLSYEDFRKAAEVSVTFCDNAYIRELNRTYRNRDAATDVLSFPQFEAGEAQTCEDEPVLLGDVVLSLERARQQAKELGNTYFGEVAFLCIHSTLHLLGYDHETSPEAEEDMCARQRAIVATLPVRHITSDRAARAARTTSRASKEVSKGQETNADNGD